MPSSSANLPRILLIGFRGQVGWELQRTLAPLGSVYAVAFPEIDLSNPDLVRKCMRRYRPAVVVNAAAYTAVNKAESESLLASKVNGLAPGILAEETKKAHALLVHYSTDYVFDGSKRCPYTEDDIPVPLNAYGRSKIAGENAIRQVGCNHLIFRLSWIYSARGHNFLRSILRAARERDEIRVVDDQIGSPSWARMVAEATSIAVSKTLASQSPESLWGTYHMTAGGATSWFGFANVRIPMKPDTDSDPCRTAFR